MIPAPKGILARYKHDLTEGGTAKAHYVYKRVIAFDGEGAALVLPEGPTQTRDRLVPASRFANFDGLTGDESHPDELWPWVALLPADGWHVKYGDGTTEPIIGWALREDGQIEPALRDGNYGTIGLTLADGDVLEREG